MHAPHALQGEVRRAQASAARLIDDIGWSSPPVWPGLAHSIGFATPGGAALTSPLSPSAHGLPPTSAQLQQRPGSANGRGVGSRCACFLLPMHLCRRWIVGLFLHANPFSQPASHPRGRPARSAVCVG